MQKYRIIMTWTAWLVGLFTSPAGAQISDYQIFNNVKPAADASVVGCFMQDAQGLVWMGTDQGLYSYDGYTTQAHFQKGAVENTRINCAVVIDSVYLYLGADNGLLVYNTRADRYEQMSETFPKDIRSIALKDSVLWMGTLNGIYAYRFKDQSLVTIKQGLPHAAIYSLLHASDGKLYVGTYNGLCRYLPSEHRFERIALPALPGHSNQFVNALMEDTIHRCIWIGMEGALLQYHLEDGRLTRVGDFSDNSVKSLALDLSGRLLVGTDKGLYIYKEGEKLRHTVHDARNTHSLVNNIIWSIFSDRQDNVWIGTDNGFSLCAQHTRMHYIPIYEITGNGDGNQLFQIHRDSKERIWLGGTNGLFIKDPYRRFVLSHNRIRHIYEDRDRQIWVATDGSINLYDERRGTFVNFVLVDSTRTYNSNWAYSIYEDLQGRLWVATCLGGILVIDKQKLMRQPGKTVVADYCLNQHTGLGGDFVSQMVPGGKNDLWALLYNADTPVQRIDAATGKVSDFLLTSLTKDQSPSFLLCDEDGIMWIGVTGGVVRVASSTGAQTFIPFPGRKQSQVLSMTESETKIWASTNDGFMMVDKQSMKVDRLAIGNRQFTSLYYDRQDRYFYIGMTDELAVTTPEQLMNERPRHPFMLTGLTVNSKRRDVTAPVDLTQAPVSFRYASMLELEHYENSVSFEVSDLPYGEEEHSKLVYRLMGMSEEWTALPSAVNSISFTNLSPGDYQLQVGRLSIEGQLENEMYQLDVTILPPWYLTWWAKTLYLLIIVSLVVWAVNFFRMRHNLLQAQKDKDLVMEQMWVKMEFFKKLSEQLKQPLSRIALAAGKLSPLLNTPETTAELETVWQNLETLDGVIHEALDTPVTLVRPVMDANCLQMKLSKEAERDEAAEAELEKELDREADTEADKAKRAETAGRPLKEVQAVKIEATSQDEQLIDNVTLLIEEHLSDFDLNVNNLSEWAGISQKQLYRKVKQYTGMTPVEYIKRIRMKTAAQLLLQKKFTVAEVMYMVGFSNSSYFSKCFQSEYGVTPRNYKGE